MSLRAPKIDATDATPVAQYLRELARLDLLQYELVTGTATGAGTVSVRHGLGRAFRAALLAGVSPTGSTLVQPGTPAGSAKPDRAVDVYCAGACTFQLLVF